VEILAAFVLLPALALCAGALLNRAEHRLVAQTEPLIERIDALLPQTQCGQCGHPGCRPYAQAIAAGEAINHCPPGGEQTIRALARLLGQEPLPLDPSHGKEAPRKLAYIREAECIGCTKCIQACPVDAILGSAKHMHSVIASECTGCDLCVAPCPVDCIDMLVAKPAPVYEPRPAAPTEQACIRCGLCAEVCPAALLPQQLHRYALAQDLAQAQSLRLMDCIECGACAYVCPSHIPLVRQFQIAKTQLRDLHEQAISAAQARRRFEFHQARKAQEKAQEEQWRQERTALAARERQAPADAIAAVLARVNAKKAEQATAPPSPQDVIQAALARVNAKKAARQAAQASTAMPASESKNDEL
jgi:electron transport complex protein RnfB